MTWEHCVIALSTLLCAVSGGQTRPHIVFILADDLGWNDVSFHGSDIRTPNLDSLAASGVLLDNYYVQPLCVPTRGSLLTGKYTIHTGLQHNNLIASCPCGLPLEFPTIAEGLRENGYSTHMIGKWHQGFYSKEHLPTSRGFDTYYGYYGGIEDYFNHTFNGALDFHHNGQPVWDTGYSTELFRDQAISLVEKHADDQTKGPMFVYLAFQAVHSPFQAPEKYIEKCSYLKDGDRRVFAAMVTAMDEAIGQIKRTLQKTGLWDNTLLIFSTDNGAPVSDGGNNWPLRGGKAQHWEGGIRGVGFVSGPFLSREGATSHELMHVSDWFPTLVGLAGGDTSGMELDGYDVWGSISKEEPSPRTELIHCINAMTDPKGSKKEGSPFDNRQKAALRVGSWKLLTGDQGLGEWISPPDQPHLNASRPNLAEDLHKNLWLFDLEKDPYETNDLSATRPDIVTMMLEKLAGYETTAVPAIPKFSDPAGRPGEGGVWQPWLE